MEGNYETLELQVRQYIPPECTCRIEDMVNALPHVAESSFDPVNGIHRVKVHKGMTSAKDITKELRQCAVRCEQHVSPDEKARMEHIARALKMEMGAGKMAMHDHHAMMEAELKRSFIIAAVFTIPVLIL